MATPKDYTSTIMRMAGNIAAGLSPLVFNDKAFSGGDIGLEEAEDLLVRESVHLAEAIVVRVLDHQDKTAIARKDLGL